MICNHDCDNCIHSDCIDDRTPNAIKCARWFEKNKDAKRAYRTRGSMLAENERSVMGKNNKLINSLNQIASRNRLAHVEQASDKLVPHVYASIAIALHRKYGWGYVRITRAFAESQRIWEELGGDNMVELCERETGIILKGDRDDN